MQINPASFSVCARWALRRRFSLRSSARVAEITAQSAADRFAVDHRDRPSLIEQLAFDRMADRRFSAAGQTGQQDGCRFLAESCCAFVGRDG